MVSTADFGSASGGSSPSASTWGTRVFPVVKARVLTGHAVQGRDIIWQGKGSCVLRLEVVICLPEKTGQGCKIHTGDYVQP